MDINESDFYTQCTRCADDGIQIKLTTCHNCEERCTVVITCEKCGYNYRFHFGE